MSEYQNRFWDSLQQMTDELGDGHLGPKATFDTNSKEAEIVASFLKQWNVMRRDTHILLLTVLKTAWAPLKILSRVKSTTALLRCHHA